MISLFAIFFSILVTLAAAQGDQPPLAVGQRVHIIAHTKTYPRIEMIAEILRVDNDNVTLLVKEIIGRYFGPELDEPTLDLPRASILQYSIMNRDEPPVDRNALYTGLAVLILVILVTGIATLLFFKRFNREERRRRRQTALPGVMAILGAFGGIWIGAAISQILGMDHYEVTTVGGKRGIPEEIVMMVLSAWLFGALGFSYGKNRLARRRRQDGVSEENKRVGLVHPTDK